MKWTKSITEAFSKKLEEIFFSDVVEGNEPVSNSVFMKLFLFSTVILRVDCRPAN